MSYGAMWSGTHRPGNETSWALPRASWLLLLPVSFGANHSYLSYFKAQLLYAQNVYGNVSLPLLVVRVKWNDILTGFV